MTSDATRTTSTRHGGSQDPGTHAHAHTSPAPAPTGAQVRDARAQHQPPDAITEAQQRARALREDAARVIALLPPPTPRQLRRLARIWPPRTDSDGQ